MVSPVNGDKSITSTTARSGESNSSAKPQQGGVQTETLDQKATEPVSATLEVDKARQLYEMESQKNLAAGPAIETPEEARSVLGQILEQFSQTPALAMKTQAPETTATLASLLNAAPA
ncbi:MAG: hypothetical protein KZQ75_14760 [Candidatus Thiodiazotropha sp. (ex Myrtea spinifera)]|nr:hypothetical protein [Candidatus Thiodiazotropha sp. (ex Myrtea spinifera)]MCU7827740.1 hypothetical protein [Candidatus Thiodiazotropha sp. (ex Myrtea sp. 'scaly one' KF741663)]